MIITCTRRIQFAAGHRVYQHESKCANLHGHNYVVFLEAQGDSGDLDQLGRVIDFSVLKDRLGGWIDRMWDHGFLYFTGDSEAAMVMTQMRGQKSFELPMNPTAENIASYILKMVGPITLARTGVHLTKVTVWETENCYATAELKEAQDAT
jgi:6-pyruvoyltetrahydropterin/6-carboxytetrahydropterin synthase